MNTPISEFQKLVGEVLRVQFPGDELLENYRPDWMRGLEFDFYLPRWKLAVEVQGWQHKYYVPIFHKSIDDFEAQRRRDRFKQQLAKERGIRLLCVMTVRDLYGQLRKGWRKRGGDWHPLPKDLKQRIQEYARNTDEQKKAVWVAYRVKGHSKTLKQVYANTKERRAKGNAQ